MFILHHDKKERSTELKVFSQKCVPPCIISKLLVVDEMLCHLSCAGCYMRKASYCGNKAR